jgi:hypothetical protein
MAPEEDYSQQKLRKLKQKMQLQDLKQQFFSAPWSPFLYFAHRILVSHLAYFNTGAIQIQVRNAIFALFCGFTGLHLKNSHVLCVLQGKKSSFIGVFP